MAPMSAVTVRVGIKVTGSGRVEARRQLGAACGFDRLAVTFIAGNRVARSGARGSSVADDCAAALIEYSANIVPIRTVDFAAVDLNLRAFMGFSCSGFRKLQ
jgi:hypothetical protein